MCHLGSDPSLDTLEVEIMGPLNRADAARELVEKVACSGTHERVFRCHLWGGGGGERFTYIYH